MTAVLTGDGGDPMLQAGNSGRAILERRLVNPPGAAPEGAADRSRGVSEEIGRFSLQWSEYRRNGAVGDDTPDNTSSFPRKSV